MANLPTEADVLIVGAGPSGLALGAMLAKSQASIAIVDRQVAGANTSRAAVIHARTLEVLEAIGATPELLARGVKVPIFRIRDKDNLLISIDFSGLPTAYPFTLMCPQDETEQVLLGRLEANGAQVIRPAMFRGASDEGDTVRAQIDFEGRVHEINCKYIVGCDGSHSLVREAAGIAFEGGSYQEDFVLGDVRMTWPKSREEIALFFSPAGLVVVAPLPHDRYRIVATAADAPETPSIDFLQAVLDARGPRKGAARVTEVVWGSRFHVHHRIAGTPRRGRFLLCGDAAHVHSPAGGQGMNTGIQDAIALARPLVGAVLSGDEAALDAWAEARHQIAQKVVRLTDRITRAATLESAPAQTLRNVALRLAGHLPQVRQAIARNLAELGNR